MFHKITIIINTIVFCCCAINYYYIYIINNTQFDLKTLVCIIVFCLIFLFISFLILLITSLITKVKVGKPPLNSLVIAYKFGFSDTVTSSNLIDHMKVFPKRDIIQICYENRRKSFGIAHGVVIHDNIVQNSEQIITDNTLELLGYHVLHTKGIPNALYISCPTLPWLSYFGIWLILRIAYPKLYKYSKKHRLSAYPVVELYKNFSVMLMAPLSQQDYFVVPEAEPHLHRSSSCPNTSMSTVTNISPSSIHSKSISSLGHPELDKNLSQQASTQCLTAKPRNGNVQQA